MAGHLPAKVPIAGNVVSVILQMVTFAILAICLLRRTQNITNWKNLPLATWLVVIIYVDSFLFVFVTSIITRGIGINESHGVCEGGILLCLIGYMTTKILIYYFLVERAYIIRGSRAPRFKTKLWIFNCLGMIAPYCAIVVLNFVYRIAYIDERGICIIGMEKIAMLPLISFDVVVNVYLTLLFIFPLRNLYSYQHNINKALRTMAYRSFIGSCTTLISSVVNLTILMVLKGEPGWICLMCCNADILFCIVMLHWVTQVDRLSGNSSNRSQGGTHKASVTESKLAVAGTIKEWKGSGIGLTEPTKALAGTMTTEIKAVPLQGRRNHGEDAIELRGIRVQTERTQEVHDTDVDTRSEGSVSVFGYGHYVTECSVTAEKMV